MSKNKSHSSFEIRHSKLIHWFPALFYMLLIFILSSFPAPEPLRRIPIIYDIKLVHIVEYGILSLLYSYALRKTTSYPPSKIFWISVLLAFTYGLSDEFHQLFVHNRTGKIADVIGNLIGAFLFQLGYLKFYKKKLG
ncbi:VanZ family protein [Candidatus Margulisiibacteriota bacterium]